jgi:hypothetical protein
MRRTLVFAALLASAAFGAGAASALTVPFTEEFTTDVAGWENAANDPLTHEASGGPGDSAHASTLFNYFGFTNPFGGGPVLFRANDSDGASGDAFVGDWIAGDVQEVSVWVYQETPEDLTFFLRVASAFNFPGAVIANETVVSPNTWTELVFPIDPDSPLCIGETVTCAQALASVGNVQIGTSAPAALTGLDEAFLLAIDGVTISNVPEPGAVLLQGAALLSLGLFARRRG